MQLVLGVAVADSTARLALIDVAAPEAALDQFDISVAGNNTDRLVRTIVDTVRSLDNDGHRLTATNLCWADGTSADRLRNTLVAAGVGNVAVVSQADAATAFVRSAAGSAGEHTAALLLVDDTTAALSVVGQDAAHTSLIDAETIAAAGPDSACTTMLERLREEPGGAQTLYVVSTSDDAAALTERLRPDSPLPLHANAHPAYLLARGAAAAACTSYADPVAPTTAAQFATAPGPVMGEHLAYSMTDDSGSLPFAVAEEYEDTDAALQQPMAPLSYAGTHTGRTDAPEEFEEPVPAARPRILLLGSTIAAIVVVGFAVLAVGVAIGIKPTASQQAVRDTEAVPGKYLPPMPGQGVEPVEDPGAYLPPVVAVAATPPKANQHTVHAGGGSGSGGNSGGYTTSSGSTGAVAPTGGGGVPTGGNPIAVDPLGGFKLNDWLPDLPDNLVVDLGPLSETLGGCGAQDRVCALEVLGGCFPGRPGFDKCLEKKGLITTRQAVDKDQPAPACSRLTDALSCSRPKPVDTELTGPADDGQGSDSDESRSGSPGVSDQPDNRSERSNPADKPESGAPAESSDDGSADAPRASDTASTPETADSSHAPKAGSTAPTTESTEPTTTHTTKSSPSPEASTPSARPSTPTVAPPSEPKATSAAPAPPPVTTVAPPPPPEPKATSAAPPPPEPVIEAPAPVVTPEPVIEAPTPVVTPEPVAPPARSGGFGSGSSSSSGGSSSNSSGSSSSDSGSSGSEPVTTAPSSP